MAERVVADRYRLERRIATGGMGEVWAARDLELGRPVALKLLGPEADPARFEREAHAAASLSHPNVTQLFDYGAWEGRPYMVLELVPGAGAARARRDAPERAGAARREHPPRRATAARGPRGRRARKGSARQAARRKRSRGRTGRRAGHGRGGDRGP